MTEHVRHLPTYASLEAEAVSYLTTSGLGVPGRPHNEVDEIVSPTGEVLEFPAGDGSRRCLDDITWPEVGRWLGHLAGWIAFCRHLVGVNASIRVAAAAAAVQAEREAYIASTCEKIPDRRADAKADPVVERLRAIEEEAHRRDKLLGGRLGGLEAKYQAMSREQARREGEHREAGPIRRPR